MDGFWIFQAPYPKIDHAEQLSRNVEKRFEASFIPKMTKKVQKNSKCFLKRSLDAFFTKKEASNFFCPFLKVVQHGRFLDTELEKSKIRPQVMEL